MLSHRRYIPRIQYKRVILNRATWIVDTDTIAKIKNAKEPRKEILNYAKEWEIPQYICICHGDNELFIDIKNESYLELFLNEIIKSAYPIKIVEWLETEKDDLGKNFFQFILPLQNHSDHKFLSLPTKKDVGKGKQFEPGRIKH